MVHVHVPSLLIGSAFSIASFLVVHEQLSHRSRLSAKWGLTEVAERRLRTFVTKVVESNQSSKQLSESGVSFAKAWNGAITYVQDALRRDR